MDVKKITPAVDKRILVLLAGLMWCGVGVMLIGFAASWLSALYNGIGLALFLSGIRYLRYFLKLLLLPRPQGEQRTEPRCRLAIL